MHRTLVYHHFESIDSTNTYAKAHALQFHPDQLVLISADEQTAGRGRFKRPWISPKGVNLYATYCFFIAPEFARSISQMAAVSIATLLLSYSLSPQIKWPNDLLLNRKKIAGILSEVQFQTTSAQVFLGIGINVNMSQSFLDTIDQPATSLAIETKRIWDRKALLSELTEQIQTDLALFEKEGFASFYTRFEALLANRNEMIRIHDGATTWEGIFESITSDGKLTLRLADGSHRVFFSGDIQ